MEFQVSFVNRGGQGITKLTTEGRQKEVPSTSEVFIVALVLDRSLNQHLKDGFQVTVGALNVLSGNMELTGETGAIIYDLDEEESGVVIPEALNPPIQTVTFSSFEENLSFNFENLDDKAVEVYGTIQILYTVS